MRSQHPLEEGSTGSIYEEATLTELVPPHPPPRAAPTISARTSFTSGSVFKHKSSADFYYTSDPRDYPLPPPPSTIRSASRSTLSRDDMPGGSTSFPLASTSYPPAPPPSHRYTESLPSLPPQSSRAHSSHYPGNSYLHPSDSRSNHNNNHYHEGDLPSFSRWSPTWISGGYSDDGRGYTNRAPMNWQRPSESYLSGLGGRGRWVADGELDEEGGGGSNKWNDVGGGTYQHGVGYDSGPSGSSGKKEGRKTKDRMKRLEKEFGKDDQDGEGGNLSVKELMKKAKMEGKRDKAELAERSGVDSKGRLLVNGSKKRLTMRWFQLIGALGVGVAIISTSIFTHPKEPPPPASKPPIYFLYLLPFLSVALTVYLFLIRPCVHRSRSKRSNFSQPQSQGFVIPLLGGGQMYDSSNNNSSGCCCFGSSRKKQTLPGSRGKGAQQQQQYFQQQPTVNLVMDATMLESLMRDQGYTSKKIESRRSADDTARRKKKKKRRTTKEREDRKYRRNKRANGEDSDSSSSPNSSKASSSSSDAWSDSPSSHPGSNVRKNLLSTPLIQSLHRAARSGLKKITAWDILLTIAWSALSIGSIGWGQKCTPGSAQGWCNLYNSALALSAFTAASFAASVVFDVLDLKRSGSG